MWPLPRSQQKVRSRFIQSTAIGTNLPPTLSYLPFKLKATYAFPGIRTPSLLQHTSASQPTRSHSESSTPTRWHMLETGTEQQHMFTEVFFWCCCRLTFSYKGICFDNKPSSKYQMLKLRRQEAPSAQLSHNDNDNHTHNWTALDLNVPHILGSGAVYMHSIPAFISGIICYIFMTSWLVHLRACCNSDKGWDTT